MISLARSFLGVTACLYVIAGLAEARGAQLTVADLGNQIRLSAPAISPDGKRIAVVTSRAKYANNRFESSLVLVDAQTGAPHVLISQASTSSPLWSPSGDRLAWLGTKEGGEPQIYVMSVDGTRAAPVRVTNVKTGVRSNIRAPVFEWSSDGKFIAFITADEPPQRQDDERFNRSFEVFANDYLTTESPPTFHVWLVPASGGTPKRLTSGVESVTGIGWLRNSGSIAFVTQPRPHNSALDYAEFMNASSRTTALKTVDIGTGKQRALVPDMARIISPPVSAPNGEMIAYLHFSGPDPWTYPHNVAVIQSSGGAAKDITAHLDRDIIDYAWLPDSKALLVTAPNVNRWALWVQPLVGQARRLDLGPVLELTDLTVSKAGAFAFVGTQSQVPSELYLMTSLDAKPRRLTHFNDNIAARDLGRTTTIRWQLDGFQQTGALIYPPGFKQGQKVPLVLDIHGGPEGTSTEAFALWDQILAAQGWAIFKPNYRGSDSQGKAYEAAVINDLGDGPGRDIMAGIAAVKALNIVDEDRIAVSGWSYGGYLTAWLIGHYQGWRAAVAGAPLTLILDWYDLSCCNAWADPILGGSPWRNNNVENYWRHSPVAYAANVKTPTLLLHNLADPEAPFTQSYHFFHALRDNGVPVKFIAYHVLGHGPGSDPVNERDKLRRWIAWIDQHFREPAKGGH